MAKQRRRNTTTKKGAVSRRRFIRGAIAASAATGVVGALPASSRPTARAPGKEARGTRGGSSDTELKVLTAEQGIVLTAALNRLIPASDGMPAAGDVEVMRYIDGVLADAPHLRQPILGLLAQLPEAERVTRLPDAELDALLTRLQTAEPDKFAVLLQATYTGYYGHPTVLAKLGWLPPGEAKPEAFDVGLLDDVRARGPLYRNV